MLSHLPPVVLRVRRDAQSIEGYLLSGDVPCRERPNRDGQQRRQYRTRSQKVENEETLEAPRTVIRKVKTRNSTLGWMMVFRPWFDPTTTYDIGLIERHLEPLKFSCRSSRGSTLRKDSLVGDMILHPCTEASARRCRRRPRWL